MMVPVYDMIPSVRPPRTRERLQGSNMCVSATNAQQMQLHVAWTEHSGERNALIYDMGGGTADVAR